MKPIVLVAAIPLLLAAGPALRSTPDLGKAEGRCRAGESGPALLVEAVGMKDRSGNMKLEVYPSNEQDFLADDNVLIAAGKTFRRVEAPTPQSGAVVLCVRIPGPGTYAVSMLHDRNTDRRFNWKIDGIGFSGNPKLGWSKPNYRKASVRVSSGGVSKIQVTMNYKNGLGVSPLKQ
ncbi:DUF2141 domain-containing protein [Novosphingobium sp.]|uniref:DUF2141 domain-containing protein n=1 Tax=Novosphingobium sp. TaxID=1874826 RepID=UPI0025FA62BE|nr:DUF2141 domain-containing protein [Novosphingobium sp.]MCC6926559.1 DUF2141 domain-containing protein [Novosphingobium sp.]